MLNRSRPTSSQAQQSASQVEAAEESRLLFQRFIGGDNQAFRVLYVRHNQRVLGYCGRMVCDPLHAEDLAQEAWGRLIELRSGQRLLENPIGFLMRIARNLCLDYLKANRRQVSLNNVNEAELPVSFIPEPSELEELVVRSLQRLSFDHREVLVLNIYCGYSLEEIARMLGKTPQAIWTRASRARAALRAIVQKAGGRDGSARAPSRGGVNQ
ncbi:MAG: sigma-70 family RNA polymerase sigma factor [Bacteroidetes bacterium]|nr:sigma-70 family RNA polymerase sigma factor [Bacteroidota bacterium]